MSEMKASTNFAGTRFPKLRFDHSKHRSNIHELEKMIDTYVQTTFETLYDCISTRKLSKIQRPKVPAILRRTASSTSGNQLSGSSSSSSSALGNSSVPSSSSGPSSTSVPSSSNAPVTRGRKKNGISGISTSTPQITSSSSRRETTSSPPHESDDDDNNDDEDNDLESNSDSDSLGDDSDESTVGDDDDFFSNLSPAVAQSCFESEYNNYVLRKQKRKDELSRLYGVLKDTISSESKNKIKAHESYNRARVSMNGFLFWKIMYATHQVSNLYMTEAQQRTEVARNYHSLVQHHGQSLAGYYETVE